MQTVLSSLQRLLVVILLPALNWRSSLHPCLAFSDGVFVETPQMVRIYSLACLFVP